MAAISPMRIGLDFDNTIVSYDAAIVTLANQLLQLPPEIAQTKLGLRDYLRKTGRETEWTCFQGELYGPGMAHAQPFEGAIKTMQELVAEGHQLMIVSHRSLKPYSGPPYDLHGAARCWIEERLNPHNLFTGEEVGNGVNFLESLHSKLRTIATLGCEVFLDDLPEVLNEPNFPKATAGILFAPGSENVQEEERLQISAWEELPSLLNSIL